jgi:hypothetical protein
MTHCPAFWVGSVEVQRVHVFLRAQTPFFPFDEVRVDIFFFFFFDCAAGAGAGGGAGGDGAGAGAVLDGIGCTHAGSCRYNTTVDCDREHANPQIETVVSVVVLVLNSLDGTLHDVAFSLSPKYHNIPFLLACATSV